MEPSVGRRHPERVDDAVPAGRAGFSPKTEILAGPRTHAKTSRGAGGVLRQEVQTEERKCAALPTVGRSDDAEPGRS